MKAEAEKTSGYGGGAGGEAVFGLGKGSGRDVEGEEEGNDSGGKGRDEWLEIGIEIPGMRDDDALPVFLSAMLTEALLADGALKGRLWINNRFHWRLYVDVRTLPQPTI